MIALSDLLCHNVEEVLVTPLLRQAVVGYTRNLFYGGAPVRSCDSSCRNYFRRLQLEGVETQKKLENMKYQLKKDTVLVHNGQVFNSSTLTDKIAVEYLKKFPKGIKNFNVKADSPAPKAETEKDKLLKRAQEFGIEAGDLSAKKLKEAIADAELNAQKKEREDLALKAIDLGIEFDDETTTERLKALIEESEALK